MSAEFLPAPAEAGLSLPMIVQAGAVLAGGELADVVRAAGDPASAERGDFPDPNRFIHSMSVLNRWLPVRVSSTREVGGAWALNNADLDESQPLDHPSVWFQVGISEQEPHSSLPLVALATVADTYVTRCFGSSGLDAVFVVPVQQLRLLEGYELPSLEHREAFDTELWRNPASDGKSSSAYEVEILFGSSVPASLPAVAAELAEVLSDAAGASSVMSVESNEAPEESAEPTASLGRICRTRTSLNDFIWDGPATAEIRLSIDVPDVSITFFGWGTSIISEIIRTRGCDTSAVISWQPHKTAATTRSP